MNELTQCVMLREVNIFCHGKDAWCLSAHGLCYGYSMAINIKYYGALIANVFFSMAVKQTFFFFLMASILFTTFVHTGNRAQKSLNLT